MHGPSPAAFDSSDCVPASYFMSVKSISPSVMWRETWSRVRRVSASWKPKTSWLKSPVLFTSSTFNERCTMRFMRESLNEKPGAGPGFSHAGTHPRSALHHEPVLVREEGGQVHEVLVGELLDLHLHDGILALAVLVVAQRRQQVVRVLSREVRELRAHADALRAMARLAGRRLLLAHFGIARGAESGKGEREGERQGGECLRHGGPHFFSATAAG